MALHKDLRDEVYGHVALSLTRNERNKFVYTSKQIAKEYVKVEEKLALQEFKLLLLKEPEDNSKKLQIIKSHLEKDFPLWLKERRAYPFFEPFLIKKSRGTKLSEMTIKEEMKFLLDDLKDYLKDKENLSSFFERSGGRKYWEEKILDSSVHCNFRLYFVPRKFRFLKIFCHQGELDHPILLERDFFPEALETIQVMYYEHEHFGIGKTIFSNLKHINISCANIDCSEKFSGLESMDPLGRTTPALMSLIIEGTQYSGLTELIFDGHMPQLKLLNISKTYICDIEGWEFVDKVIFYPCELYRVVLFFKTSFRFIVPTGVGIVMFASGVGYIPIICAALIGDFIIAKPIDTAQKIYNGYNHLCNGCEYVTSDCLSILDYISNGYEQLVRNLFSGHNHTE